jgi:hypothetical protein
MNKRIFKDENQVASNNPVSGQCVREGYKFIDKLEIN